MISIWAWLIFSWCLSISGWVQVARYRRNIVTFRWPDYMGKVPLTYVYNDARTRIDLLRTSKRKRKQHHCNFWLLSLWWYIWFTSIGRRPWRSSISPPASAWGGGQYFDFNGPVKTILQSFRRQSWLTERRPVGSLQVARKWEREMDVGIIRDNPGVFQLYPYPTHWKPSPSIRGKGFCGFG